MSFKLPDALVIVAAILLLFIGLTWIIPAGDYDRQEVDGRQIVVPGSFHYVEASPQSPLEFFVAPLKGLVAAAHIIAFVFLIGGAFSILTATGAVNAGLQQLIRFSVKKPQYKKAILPLLIIFFSAGGCTFGMSEEVLVFILITIPMAYALGYDSIVGVAIPFVGAAVGFAGAMFNPFTVGIAQGIADVQVFSVWEYRLVVWLLFTLVAVLFIMRYAAKVGAKPASSPVFGLPRNESLALDRQEQLPLTAQRVLVLSLFLASLVLLVFGVNQWGWYIEEIAGLFVALGIFSAIACLLPLQKTIDAFILGAKDMMAAALIIGLSRGILVVAEEGRIIDTILNALTGATGNLPNYISVQAMLFLQVIINFFIPSGSGQAALTMPVMSPLSDLLGISRQTAVLAYQFGDGITNLIIPTSGVTMGILAIAKIPYEIWLRWIWKFILLLFLMSMIFLALPTAFFSWQ
ncbi:MAG: TIGR00366 family protein [Bacteroidia bacterium]